MELSSKVVTATKEVLLKYAQAIAEGDKRLIMGIDGLSRSGKTTATSLLSYQLYKNQINVAVFHLDDFIVERRKRYHTGNEEWYEYYHLQWDVEWLKANFFQKLKSAETVTLPFYDETTDCSHNRQVDIPTTCIMIIEGIFLQRKEWTDFLDYTIYIESSREKRFERENVETQLHKTKFEKRYWPAEEYYQKIEQPIQQADIVIVN